MKEDGPGQSNAARLRLKKNLSISGNIPGIEPKAAGTQSTQLPPTPRQIP